MSYEHDSNDFEKVLRWHLEKYIHYGHQKEKFLLFDMKYARELKTQALTQIKTVIHGW